jgi:hypothetical protein
MSETPEKRLLEKYHHVDPARWSILMRLPCSPRHLVAFPIFGCGLLTVMVSIMAS